MKSKMDAIGGRIDLNLLVVFDAIYRSRNLTAAGRALGLSQPAMSHALGRLRTLFKDPLFVRLPRGLYPTPLADDVAPALMEGLGTIRGGLDRRTFEPAESRRVFNLGMSDVAEVTHLPLILDAARASAPHVRLNTTEVAGSRLRDALADGEVDMATGDYDLGAGCRSVALYASTYACVLRADHPVIGARLTLKQFRAVEHVLVAPQGAFHHGEAVDRVLARREVNARIAVRVSHFHGIMALVTSSDLIATIPRRLAQTMQRFANIKVLEPPVALPKIRVSLYWHERFHRDPGNAWLRGIYIKVLSGRD
jgi:DNA-binding transcriptional LysR family regulator